MARLSFRCMSILLLVSASLAPHALTSAGLARGEVLAGIGNGVIHRYLPDGTFAGALDDDTDSQYVTGMCLDRTFAVFVTNRSTGQLSKLDPSGALAASSFSAGMTGPESCALDAAGNVLVSETGGSIRKVSPAGATLATYPTGRADWMDLAADGCTAVFTAEGTVAARYDLCANEPLTPLATDLPGPCFAIRLRSNGEALTACGGQAVRLSAAGAIVKTYAGPALEPPSSSLLPLALDPDGTTFWTGDYANGQIYRIDIATGAQVTTFKATPISFLDALLVIGPAPKRGDANADGRVDVSDVFLLVNTIFAAGPPPAGNCDVDGNGSVNVGDVFFAINYLFAAGPPPVL
jgi:DNA-binding beta-propeller fold protein YncE